MLLLKTLFLKLNFYIYLLALTWISSALKGQSFEFNQVLPSSPALQLTAELNNLSISAVAFSDIDNDGDFDLLTTGLARNNSNASSTTLYRNDGQGNFSKVEGTIFEKFQGGSIAFGDVDGDNDEDVILTGRYGSLHNKATILYLNDGRGIFTASSLNEFRSSDKCMTVLKDLDKDGDLDLFLSDEYSSHILSNDGKGKFTPMPVSYPDNHYGAVTFADVNNDGYEDMFITGGFRSSLFINKGSLTFEKDNSNIFPPLDWSAAQLADLNGDGSPDLILTGEQSLNGTRSLITKIYQNKNGLFEESYTIIPPLKEASLDITDIDNDKDLDIIINGDIGSLNYTTILYENDGQGIFSEKNQKFVSEKYRSVVKFQDVNNDKSPDFLIVNLIKTNIYINNGHGQFAPILNTPFYHETSFNQVVLGDVDGDSDSDVLVLGSRPHHLYLNDGNGFFNDDTTAKFPELISPNGAFADVDNDNDLDLILTGSMNRKLHAILFSNNGKGQFTIKDSTTFEGIQEGYIAFADIDNDSDQDVLITGQDVNRKAAINLYKNDGNGNFTLQSDSRFNAVQNGIIVFADIDNDNDQDVLIKGHTGFSYSNTLYINDGSGIFTRDYRTFLPPFGGRGACFADLDHDNDLDLFLVGNGYSSFEKARLYLNDGTGRFLQSPQSFNTLGSGDAVLTDLDGDGDLDIFQTGKLIPGSFSYGSELYFNNGDGTFSEMINSPFEPVSNAPFVFSNDIDGDSDEDILVFGINMSGDASAKAYKKSFCSSTLSIDGPNLISNTENATYQWLNCDEGFAPISGEKSQTFTPIHSGEYAVRVSDTKCIGISPCTAVYITENKGSHINGKLSIYPNPVLGRLNINLNGISDKSVAYLKNIHGDILESVILHGNQTNSMIIKHPAGLYFLDVVYGSHKETYKIAVAQE
ncbi:MAG: T9SS type A sorting domain-containing protein [Sporocytophaga sp.]|nr:T9SS type A sorting domain-containing protein [Sporocytophaga sp.]